VPPPVYLVEERHSRHIPHPTEERDTTSPLIERDWRCRALSHPSRQSFNPRRTLEPGLFARTLNQHATKEEGDAMKAITYREYGSPDVLAVQDIARPAVTDNAVLVQVRAASANPYDWHFMRGEPYFIRIAVSGLRKPKRYVLGSDIAGQVEAVGKGVTRFRPGDAVFGFVGHGGFAEYVAVPEDVLGLKPSTLTFEQAASVPLAALTALQGVRDAGRIQPGQRVLIVGASGGVGTFAVQIAKVFGAEVTGVCSTRNVELVRSLGADHVVDYTQEDFTRAAERYDLILDNVGNHSMARTRRALIPTGILISNGGGHADGKLGRTVRAMVASMIVRRQASPTVKTQNHDDLVALKGLVEAGKVTPVIDRTYPLPETPAAIGHVAAGHTRGTVVITV
jgi:NADPH:quinone reductase-like Zn-dependent oxidoreductase